MFDVETQKKNKNIIAKSLFQYSENQNSSSEYGG
jgi:hypothetical protein